MNYKEYNATFVLSLAVCLEMLVLPVATPPYASEVLECRQLGTSSRWWGYLASLPKHVDIALFWGVDGGNDSDADQAICWLQGTELEKHIVAGRATTLVIVGAKSDSEQISN